MDQHYARMLGDSMIIDRYREKVNHLRAIAKDFEFKAVMSLDDIDKKYPELHRLCALLDHQRGFAIREEIAHLVLESIGDADNKDLESGEL